MKKNVTTTNTKQLPLINITPVTSGEVMTINTAFL
jgi:hypothetical protein